MTRNETTWRERVPKSTRVAVFGKTPLLQDKFGDSGVQARRPRNRLASIAELQQVLDGSGLEGGFENFADFLGLGKIVMLKGFCVFMQKGTSPSVFELEALDGFRVEGVSWPPKSVTVKRSIVVAEALEGWLSVLQNKLIDFCLFGLARHNSHGWGTT